MSDSIWKNVNYFTNSSVNMDGFIYIQHVYFKLYNEYINLIPEHLPSSEDEAMELTFKLDEPHYHVAIYENILEILACTSIESLINTAGIHAMTEKFYKKTIERNDIVSKIRLLIFSISNTEIEENNLILRNIRALFDRRNSLVHPKSKKILSIKDMEQAATNHLDTDNSNIIRLLKNYEKILEFFHEYDLIHESVLIGYNERKYDIKLQVNV